MASRQPPRDSKPSIMDSQQPPALQESFLAAHEGLLAAHEGFLAMHENFSAELRQCKTLTPLQKRPCTFSGRCKTPTPLQKRLCTFSGRCVGAARGPPGSTRGLPRDARELLCKPKPQVATGGETSAEYHLNIIS